MIINDDPTPLVTDLELESLNGYLDRHIERAQDHPIVLHVPVGMMERYQRALTSRLAPERLQLLAITDSPVPENPLDTQLPVLDSDLMQEITQSFPLTNPGYDQEWPWPPQARPPKQPKGPHSLRVHGRGAANDQTRTKNQRKAERRTR